MHLITKPVKPAAHGVIDYLFSGIQLAVPGAMGMNTKAARTFQLIGSTFLVMNAFTDTPVGIRPVVSFKNHQKADATFLIKLAALGFFNFIRKDRKAKKFHLAFLAAAAAHYILTDYNARS